MSNKNGCVPSFEEGGEGLHPLLEIWATMRVC